jgi:hypothetical protein
LSTLFEYEGHLPGQEAVVERKLIKRVQFLQAYSLALTAMLAAVLLTGFAPKLEFLDADGKVFYSLPQK